MRTNTTTKSGRATGFTLVELLIVMFILSVLIAIIVSVAGYVMRNANEKETAATQALLMNAIEVYRDNVTPKVSRSMCTPSMNLIFLHNWLNRRRSNFSN